MTVDGKSSSTISLRLELRDDVILKTFAEFMPREENGVFSSNVSIFIRCSANENSTIFIKSSAFAFP